MADMTKLVFEEEFGQFVTPGPQPSPDGS
jgi:hypothetical protein